MVRLNFFMTLGVLGQSHSVQRLPRSANTDPRRHSSHSTACSGQLWHTGVVSTTLANRSIMVLSVIAFLQGKIRSKCGVPRKCEAVFEFCES